MTDKLKQNLRYQKAAAKLDKPIYPNSPEERNLVKLSEASDDLIKWKDRIWQSMYANGFKPNIDNSNPKFFPEFDQLKAITKRLETISKKISNMEAGGFDLGAALNSFYLLNRGRGSQSY